MVLLGPIEPKMILPDLIHSEICSLNRTNWDKDDLGRLPNHLITIWLVPISARPDFNSILSDLNLARPNFDLVLSDLALASSFRSSSLRSGFGWSRFLPHLRFDEHHHRGFILVLTDVLDLFCASYLSKIVLWSGFLTSDFEPQNWRDDCTKFASKS